jgi:glycosyltransferase involved in cell wall biosynthesis
MKKIRVDLGLFAHNEAAGIAAMMQRLIDQDVWHHPKLDLHVHVLANGSTDDTVAKAQWAASDGFRVHDLSQAGKSQTWNRFVHDLSRRDAKFLIFCDADISFPEPDCLSRLILGLLDRPDLHVLNSQPVKDIAMTGPQTLTERLIAASAGGLDDWKTAICGQLYAMPAACARRMVLPIGLLVEDGFLRAMVLTDRFSDRSDFSRIDGLDGLFHIYPSERTVLGLIRHQTRLVVGSAINDAVFRHLDAGGFVRISPELLRAASDEAWLADVIRHRLPRIPYGYVSPHFLFRRLTNAPRKLLSPKRLALALLGFGFDAIVYVNAQIRMARGTATGFW